jgi:hypothetical protein
MAADMHNILLAMGDTAAAQSEEEDANADMTQLQQDESTTATDALLGRAPLLQGSEVAAAPDYAAGNIDAGNLIEEESIVAEQDSYATEDILLGNYNMAADMTSLQDGLGDGGAPSELGGTSGALFTQAYAAEQAAGGADYAAASNPGNYSLASAAAAATVAAEIANVTALNAIGNTYGADVEQSNVNAATAAGDTLAAQQAVQGMTPAP